MNLETIFNVESELIGRYSISGKSNITTKDVIINYNLFDFIIGTFNLRNNFKNSKILKGYLKNTVKR